LEKTFGVDSENLINRPGESFKYSSKDIKKSINELIEKMIKEGYPIFDIDKIMENKKEYSDILSKLTEYDEKRIREDKDYRFNKEFKKSLNKLKEILISEGYIDETGELTEKSLMEYSKYLIGNIEKEIEGIFEYGKYLSYYIGNDEEFYKKYFSIGDKYNKINIKETIRKFIRNKDVVRFIVDVKRESKGGKYIILLDVSGSMIGEKIFEAKKALILLISKILEDNNLLDIILFNDKIVKEYNNVRGLKDVIDILKIIPNGSTDIALAFNYLLNKGERGHIILITDALPTKGKNPVERTLKLAKELSQYYYISIIGIQLNSEGEKIAKEIVKYGRGRLFISKDIKDLKKLLLLEYEISRQQMIK
jgi:uncharacterized protein with von Willebrand factor type A (vWA) domain